MIDSNWVSVFLIKKSVFLIKNISKKNMYWLWKMTHKKSVLIIKCRSSKIGLPYQKLVFKNKSYLGKIRVYFPKIRVEPAQLTFFSNFLGWAGTIQFCFHKFDFIPQPIFFHIFSYSIFSTVRNRPRICFWRFPPTSFFFHFLGFFLPGISGCF